MKNTKKIQLLSPAGNLAKLKIALNFGADAVYGSVSHFSLRNRASKDFTLKSFIQGIEYAHSLGKKVFVAINGFPFNSQIDSLKNHIAMMRDLAPDAFIVATPGVISLAKEIAPHIPLHLSTQANVLNVLDAKVFFDMGVKRIVAARELSLKDCVEIKNALPDLELEIFTHGSMCFAFSGRCLISALQHGRVPNRGSCANDCRFDYEYYVRDVESDKLVRFDGREFYVKNPDNDVMMRVQEEQGVGSHIFNAKDLNLASNIQQILESNAIDALKIEGRTKSSYYAGITARTYRMAIDDFYARKQRKSLYQYELHTLKNRGFTEGYIVQRPFQRLDTQESRSAMSEGSFQVCGEVDSEGKTFMCKHSLRVGQWLEILSPLEYYKSVEFGDSFAFLGEDTSKRGVENSSAKLDRASEQNLSWMQGLGRANKEFKDLRLSKMWLEKESKESDFIKSKSQDFKDSKDSKDSIKPTALESNLEFPSSHSSKIFCTSLDSADAYTSYNNYAISPTSLYPSKSAIKEGKLRECQNELGQIVCVDNRYYLRLFRILALSGKEFKCIHSGNTNPVLLPFILPPFSFLRIKIN